MTNFYSLMEYGERFSSRMQENRRDPWIQYTLIDYNLSIMFGQDATEQECRLPADKAWVSVLAFQPPDVLRGQYDYDLFAYDVGCLGNIFRFHFVVSILLSASEA